MNVAERVGVLADQLADSRELSDPRWRAALYAVPRHLFVPAVAWANPYQGPGYLVDRERDPKAWWDAAYADQSIITQLDDGATEIGAGAGSYTSSLSAPGAVVEFLEILDPYDGDRVLEIGTGTGWTAGLLSARLGAESVISIEIDPRVHARATRNLAEAGYAPRLILGDGALGWPEAAPYDRVHVTVGVREVPYAWVEQVRPGGTIALPWMPDVEPGHKVCLTVGDDGTAAGRFAGGARYMMLRGQRAPAAPKYEGGYRKRTASLDPRQIFRSGYGADVTIAACLTDVCVTRGTGDPFEAWAWTDDSGAHVVGRDVEQFGERDLWDELEAAFFRWLSLGQPERNRFGLTVAPEGQGVWLDRPDNTISNATR